MRHHKHHRRERRSHHRRRWGRKWMAARSIHRRVVGFLLLAVVLGMIGGWGISMGASMGHGHGWCLFASVILATWPLAWVATFRIARPVSELADVASELRDGKLKRREDIDEGGPEEVGEVAGVLRGMADRVAKQLDDQRSLMAAVSHELRSPLARLRVMVELAREGQGSPSLHDDLQGEIDGMDALVGDLLAAARIDFEAINPTALAPREVALRALQIAGMGPEQLVADGELGEVVADATLLGRAIAGLLDNARRYGGDRVRLVVTGGETVRFAVEDDGDGFADGEEEQVFQPFWRKAPTADAPPTQGVGLGLALVRQIAESHGGTAAAANREGGGAVVWVELPR